MLLSVVICFFNAPHHQHLSSHRGPVQPAPGQGAAARPEPDATRSGHPRRQVHPGGQHQRLAVADQRHPQVAAAAQQPADPKGKHCGRAPDLSVARPHSSSRKLDHLQFKFCDLS